MSLKEKLKARAERLKVDIPALFIALGRPETPFWAKAAAWLAVASALSPIDLIPDFIPVLGYLDDMIILPALVALSIKLIPPETLESCRAEAREQRARGGKRRWLYALPIAAVWAIVLFVIVKAVTGASRG